MGDSHIAGDGREYGGNKRESRCYSGRVRCGKRSIEDVEDERENWYCESWHRHVGVYECSYGQDTLYICDGVKYIDRGEGDYINKHIHIHCMKLLS